jgi:transcriptional regulator with XRE-family HTH domain
MKLQIQEILSRYQLSAAEFAKIVGVNPSGVSHILSGRRNYLSIETILKIVQRFPEIDLDWLITGSGSMKRDPEDMGKQHYTDNLSVNSPDAERTVVSEDDPVVEDIKTQNAADFTAKVATKIIIYYSDSTYQELIPT